MPKKTFRQMSRSKKNRGSKKNRNSKKNNKKVMRGGEVDKGIVNAFNTIWSIYYFNSPYLYNSPDGTSEIQRCINIIYLRLNYLYDYHQIQYQEAIEYFYNNTYEKFLEEIIQHHWDKQIYKITKDLLIKHFGANYVNMNIGEAPGPLRPGNSVFNIPTDYSYDPNEAMESLHNKLSKVVNYSKNTNKMDMDIPNY